MRISLLQQSNGTRIAPLLLSLFLLACGDDAGTMAGTDGGPSVDASGVDASPGRDAGGADGGTGDGMVDGCPDDPDKVEPGVCGCGVPDDDSDGDGALDCEDACPDDSDKVSTGLCGCGVEDTDGDGDGTVDCNDACPGDADKVTVGMCGCGVADTDTDGDLTADCVDDCPSDVDKVAAGICGCGTPDTDSDGDGTVDCEDGCSGDADKTEPGTCGCGTPDADVDGNGTLDCLEPCPDDPAKETAGVCGCGVPDVDTDGDGTLDCNDECPSDMNKTLAGVCGCGTPDTDADGDGTPNCNDQCPTDSTKLEPGVCGCGVSDDDSDGDGTLDCNDGCPTDDTKTESGMCGCGVPDTDSDGDGTADCVDDCPADMSKTEPGTCGCGVADVDTDGDGVLDCEDGCPSDMDKTEPGTCGCGVADVDGDGDGVLDCNDGCPSDMSKTEPGMCGCGVADDDTDGDGTVECLDNCPGLANPDQDDANGDGVGDACTTCTDEDGDGYGVGSDRSTCAYPETDCDDTDFSLNRWADDVYLDYDRDGYGAGSPRRVCTPGTLRDGYSTDGSDCDDDDPLRWASCGSCTDADGDGRGAGCDLGTDCDDSDPNSWDTCDGSCTTIDEDRDGFFVGCDLGDCNDANTAVFPGAAEIPGDGVDNDCDGSDGALNDLDYVYVSKTCASTYPPSDDNPGTRDAPFATLEAAVNAARENSLRPGRAVVLDQDSFTTIGSGASLFGGHDCDGGWSLGATRSVIDVNDLFGTSSSLGTSKAISRVDLTNGRSPALRTTTDTQVVQSRIASTANKALLIQSSFAAVGSTFEGERADGGGIVIEMVDMSDAGRVRFESTTFNEVGAENFETNGIFIDAEHTYFRDSTVSMGNVALEVYIATLGPVELIDTNVSAQVGLSTQSSTALLVQTTQPVRVSRGTLTGGSGDGPSYGIRTQGGAAHDLEVSGSTLRVGATTGGGAAFYCGGTTSVSGRRFLEDVVARAPVANGVAVGGSNCALTIDGGDFRGGNGGADTYGIEMRNSSELIVRNAIVLGGGGTLSASIAFANGTLDVVNSALRGGNGDTSANVLLRGSGDANLVNVWAEAGSGSSRYNIWVDPQFAAFTVPVVSHTNLFMNGGLTGVDWCTLYRSTDMSCLQSPSALNASCTGCEGNIRTGPGVVSAWGNLHLSSSSAMIDAGVDPMGVVSSGAEPTDDFDGDPRPQGSGWDIGPDEYVP